MDRGLHLWNTYFYSAPLKPASCSNRILQTAHFSMLLQGNRHAGCLLPEGILDRLKLTRRAHPSPIPPVNHSHRGSACLQSLGLSLIQPRVSRSTGREQVHHWLMGQHLIRPHKGRRESHGTDRHTKTNSLSARELSDRIAFFQVCQLKNSSWKNEFVSIYGLRVFLLGCDCGISDQRQLYTNITFVFLELKWIVWSTID